MAIGEVTGKKLQQTDNLPFDQRLFTSKQVREILAEGKTKFFEDSLPELEAFLDGNKAQDNRTLDPGTDRTPTGGGAAAPSDTATPQIQN